MLDTKDKRLLCCHGCGLAHALPPLERGMAAHCERCGSVLAGSPRLDFIEHLMLYLAATILFFIAHLFPFMALELEGRRQVVTILDGVRALYDSGAVVLAGIVFVTGTVAPALRIIFAIALYMPLALGRVPRRLIWMMRSMKELRPWAMMEIYLFAVIVAYVKLVDVASIDIGPALAAFVAVIVIFVLLDGDHEPHGIWRQVEPQAPMALLRHGSPVPLSCHECDQVTSADQPNCTRCLAPLHHRRPGSLAMSWALLIAAAIFLLPANFLPIMTVTSFGVEQSSTILGGVIELIELELYPIAAVVFVASIAVPVAKIAGLALIYTAVSFRWQGGVFERAWMYRFIESIGRWSMIDIFVIALLAALVTLDNIATIQAGPAALCFAAVVIISMLSAMCFDPRLIWDQVGQLEADHG